MALTKLDIVTNSLDNLGNWIGYSESTSFIDKWKDKFESASDDEKFTNFANTLEYDIQMYLNDRLFNISSSDIESEELPELPNSFQKLATEISTDLLTSNVIETLSSTDEDFKDIWLNANMTKDEYIDYFANYIASFDKSIINDEKILAQNKKNIKAYSDVDTETAVINMILAGTTVQAILTEHPEIAPEGEKKILQRSILNPLLQGGSFNVAVGQLRAFNRDYHELLREMDKTLVMISKLNDGIASEITFEQYKTDNWDYEHIDEPMCCSAAKSIASYIYRFICKWAFNWRGWHKPNSAWSEDDYVLRGHDNWLNLKGMTGVELYEKINDILTRYQEKFWQENVETVIKNYRFSNDVVYESEVLKSHYCIHRIEKTTGIALYDPDLTTYLGSITLRGYKKYGPNENTYHYCSSMTEVFEEALKLYTAKIGKSTTTIGEIEVPLKLLINRNNGDVIYDSTNPSESLNVDEIDETFEIALQP